MGQPQFPGDAFLLPSAQARVHSWIRTDAHVSPSSHATQTHLPIPVCPPPRPNPQEKRSPSGWGLGAPVCSPLPWSLVLGVLCLKFKYDFAPTLSST